MTGKPNKSLQAINRARSLKEQISKKAWMAGYNYAETQRHDPEQAFERWFGDQTSHGVVQPACKHDGDWDTDGVSFCCAHCGAYLGEKS